MGITINTGFNPSFTSNSSTPAPVVNTVTTAEGSSDTYAIPAGKDGLVNGQEMDLMVPANRAGQTLENINVSFHAPVREWDPQGRNGQGEEKKPTYNSWYLNDQFLQKKFVDPNATSGNAPEIDNVHGANSNGPAPLGVVPEGSTDSRLRIVAQNQSIDPAEEAMTVQWVTASYRPKNVDTEEKDLRDQPVTTLPNSEWKAPWIQPGQTLDIPVDPTRKIARVEIQWSDKPDDTPFESPGKWATGSLMLDGQVLGNPHEHVGSPEWQTFENPTGLSGGKLTVRAEACPLKVFKVRIDYQKPDAPPPSP
jgi:hypothetical protein